jgi:hypothetical protein
MQLAETIGRFKASGGHIEVPTFVLKLLQAFQQCSVSEVELRNIEKPQHILMPITSDGGSSKPVPITPSTLEVSGIKGNHWDSFIKTIVSAICNILCI